MYVSEYVQLIICCTLILFKVYLSSSLHIGSLLFSFMYIYIYTYTYMNFLRVSANIFRVQKISMVKLIWGKILHASYVYLTV
jgi:hypothetical protein